MKFKEVLRHCETVKEPRHYFFIIVDKRTSHFQARTNRLASTQLFSTLLTESITGYQRMMPSWDGSCQSEDLWILCFTVICQYIFCYAIPPQSGDANYRSWRSRFKVQRHHNLRLSFHPDHQISLFGKQAAPSKTYLHWHRVEMSHGISLRTCLLFQTTRKYSKLAKAICKRINTTLTAGLWSYAIHSSYWYPVFFNIETVVNVNTRRHFHGIITIFPIRALTSIDYHRHSLLLKNGPQHLTVLLLRYYQQYRSDY